MLSDQITNEMKTAMKAGDQRRLDALRLLVSAIRYAAIDSPNLTDDQVISVLQKEAKKRREAVEAYTKAGRTESAEQEQYELSMIEEYLPTRMAESEVREKVQAILAAGNFANFGMAMNTIMKEMNGKAEGGTVAKIVKELYAEK